VKVYHTFLKKLFSIQIDQKASKLPGLLVFITLLSPSGLMLRGKLYGLKKLKCISASYTACQLYFLVMVEVVVSRMLFAICQ